ncbi:Uncharacterised protein [Pasteurella multocida]|nr:Uncharacterised protein [Pasteurella multocida]
MFYLTKSNYSKLLKALHINIPHNYIKSFYSNYKLPNFDLDLNFFTLPEAKKLVISHMLFNDIANLEKILLIEKMSINQKQWVYPINMPVYHTSQECEYLTNEFSNVRIPQSVETRSIEQIEEYRKYFIENIHNYGHKENKREPIIFCRKLKEKFHLSEEIDDIEKNYLNITELDNSGIEEFNISLDFEKEKEEIDSLISIFNNLIKTSDITPEISRKSFLLKKINHSEKENTFLMEEIYKQKQQIIIRILNYHLKYLESNNININEKVLQLAGFGLCKNSKCQAAHHKHNMHTIFPNGIDIPF